MIRKCLFTLVVSLVTIIASAQIGSGQWKIHPFYVDEKVTNCVDVGDKVYYLVSGSLFCYDKASQSNTNVDVNSAINDANIKQIYYNYDKDYLFIAYDNCNIDIIKGDGSVVNVSAIKDVVMPKTNPNSANQEGAKAINDITFGDGITYVATSFGFITIEDESFRVLEVRHYDLIVSSLAQVGDYKIMSVSSKYYYCPISDPAETVSKYKQTTNSVGKGTIYPINSNHFFLTTNAAFYIVEIAANGDGTLSFTPTLIVEKVPTSIQKYPNGFVASNFNSSQGFYYTFDSNGGNATRHNGNGIYTSHENGNWWIMNQDGLMHRVNGVMGDAINPNGISIKSRAYWTTYDPYQQRMLLSRTAENRILEVYDETTGTEIDYWDGTLWHKYPTPNYLENGGNFWIEVSPNEPDTYFFCYRRNVGVARVKNGNVVTLYGPSNAPISNRAVAIKFDSKGNLWMVQPRNPNVDVAAISAQNQLLNQVNNSHFVTNNLGHSCYTGADGGFKRMTFDIGAGDTKVYSAGNYNDPLIIWNNNEDLSLKQYKVFESFFDQDNKYYSTYGWVYVKADNDGMIWIGTVSGVISFDPRQAFDPDFHINRIKVSVDEGTNVNEVLLEGIQVNCISVDSQNRKWLGTNTNGIYLVSADGSEIIKHFDKTNSPMPNDQVYSVCYNPSTNSVLVVTATGVMEYFCDVTPSASDYSNVLVYPNPVQSSFTGYVTIKGLMDNSTVVITNAAGTKIATLHSTGGIAMWDACKTNGTPVETGIYKVYAAQGHTPSTTGKPLTKIAVIK